MFLILFSLCVFIVTTFATPYEVQYKTLCGFMSIEMSRRNFGKGMKEQEKTDIMQYTLFRIPYSGLQRFIIVAESSAKS